MKTKSAVIWNSIEAFGNQLISILTMIFLARLLDPEDFGVIGMVTIITMISSVLIEGGIAAAIIYKKNMSQSELSTLFFINFFTSVIVSLLVLLVAKPVSFFFEIPIIKPVLYFLSISFILNSLSVVPYGILAKEMNFKLISKIKIFTQLISGTLAITLAYFDFKVWALVFQTISISFFTSLFFLIFVNWKPSFVFKLAESFDSLKYGFNLILSGLLNSVFDNIYYLIIGKFYSPIDLGFYYQANRLQNISSLKIKAILQQSTFPVFTKISSDFNDVNLFFNKSLNNSLFINFYLLGLIFVISNDLIPFLLGDKWMPSVFYVKVLCVSSIFLPFFTLVRNLVLSKGDSLTNFIMDFFSKVILVIIIYFSIGNGLHNLVLSQVLFSFVLFALFTLFVYLNKLLIIFPVIFIHLKYLLIFILCISVNYVFYVFLPDLLVFKLSIIFVLYTFIFLIFAILFKNENYFTDKIFTFIKK